MTKHDLSSGSFPGTYHFDISSGDTDGSTYWIRPSGEDDTIDLTVTDY
ncbi:hypothetical protein [Levilactobacillus enshiensis]|nr:hypothetical protein [Levilactobacillus enshiensis]